MLNQQPNKENQDLSQDQDATAANFVAVTDADDDKKNKKKPKSTQPSIIAVQRGIVTNPIEQYASEKALYKTVEVGGVLGTGLLPIEKASVVRGKT
jgi:hypothetical protein